jgi:hypothetical protein
MSIGCEYTEISDLVRNKIEEFINKRIDIETEERNSDGVDV